MAPASPDFDEPGAGRDGGNLLPHWRVAALPPHHVPRPRLIEALSRAAVSLVEAPAGYGKSVLAAELSRHLGIACAWVALAAADDEPSVLAGSVRRSLKAAKLSDLAAALAGGEGGAWPDRLLDALADLDEPLLLVLDDAHHLDNPSCAASIRRLASSLQRPHRLVVLTRRVDPHLEPLGSIGAVRLTVGEVAFDRAEIARLVESLSGDRPTATQLTHLVEATGGWASALVLAASARGTTSTLGDGGLAAAGSAPARQAAVMSALVEGFLGRLSGSLRDAVAELAHLPYLSPRVVAALTRDETSFEQMINAGVPLARTASGWWEMPGPVAAHLARRGPIAAASAQRAAATYAAEGDLVQAVRLLVGTGLAAQAAELIEQRPPGEIEELGWAEVRHVVEALSDDELRRHPRALLQLSRVAETGYRMDIRRQAIERAVALVEEQGVDAVLRREIEAERARDLVWDEATRGEAGRLARAVVDASGEDETAARARALDALGRLRSWWSDDGPHDDAEALLEESARLSRHLGQPIWAARALVPLSMGLHFALCRYERALSIIDEVLGLLPARSAYRCTVLTFAVTVLTELGRLDEATGAVAEVREIAAATGEEWMLAYASWSEAEVRSRAGDRDGTLRAVREARNHRAAWFDETPGIEFLAQTADFLDRVGELDLAMEHLEEARARMTGFERVVRVYEAAVLGRSGDALLAEQVIAATLERADLDPQERWPIMLLRAAAALRRGDPQAGALAAAAFETCASLGIPDAPLRREPEAARALLPLAAAAGCAAAGDLNGAGRLTISLLGGFELRRDGRRLEPPAGRPAAAVRIVAASGARLHAEALIEVLWPGVDLATGRNRLKNLLSRLRTAVGDVLVRDGELVALARGATVDSELFEREATEALAAPPRGTDRAAGLALAALGRYRGELLPDDRYEPWAAQPRERLRLRQLELLDLLAAHAEERGEVDGAIRLLQRAIDTEPYDERRALRLAGLFASQGRVGSARGALRRARAALESLGLEPSSALDEMQSRLGSDARRIAALHPYREGRDP
ncbi:MAG TPA: BTAD domain-containing putative transcriptional regulator [Acidimicrobiales bacterium]|nr:BTAD domain-containing putative transcriptional regulator [Acidimicrobiales bacterium]